MKILFVEDNLDFAQAIIQTAHILNHQIIHTDDLGEAVDLFNSQKFDIIITDIHIQKIKSITITSGLDFVRYIRERKKSNILIALTTGMELIKEEDIRESKVDIFHYKPLNIDYDDYIKQLENAFEIKKANSI